MTEERIDIILTDKVSDEPARKIQFLATQARDAHSALTTLREQLTQINASSVRKLQEEMTASVTQTTRQATALERLEAAQARTATAVARLEKAQAQAATATLQGAVAAQRLTTEQERTERSALATALAKEKLEAATRRNTAATQQDGDAAVKLYQKNEALIEQSRRAQAAAAAQAQYNSVLGVTSGSSGAAKASMGVFAQDARDKQAAAVATADLERRTVALKSAIDPAYAAQMLYNRSVGEAAALLKAGAITQDDHARAVGLATAALNAHGGAQKKTSDLTKLTTFQMLTLQYTMNDIAASLASGASPFTILMQQGGQVTQAWGGLGNTLKALGGFLTTPIGLIGLAAAAVAGFSYAVYKGALETNAYNAVLINTGNYAGTTATQLSAMARTVSDATGRTVGAAASALTALVSTGSITSSQFDKLGTATLNWSKATGESVDKIAKEFAKLGEDPLKASLALNESQHYLTLTVYEQIKALTEQGRTLEAGVIAQNAWADALNQRTPKMLDNLGYIEKAWRGIAGAAKWAWDAMLDVGRPADSVAELKKAIAAEEAFLRTKTGGIPDNDAGLNTLRQKLAMQEKGAGYEALSAAQQQIAAKTTEAQSTFDKTHDKYLSDAVKKQRELAVLQSAFTDPNMKQTPANIAAYAESVKKIMEGPKGSKAAKIPADPWDSAIAKSYAKAMDDIDRIQLKASASADELSKTQEVLRGVMGAPTWAAYSRQQQEQIIYAASLSQAEEDHAASRKAATKATDDATRSSHAYDLAMANDNDKLEKSNKTLAEENALIGVSEDVKASLILSRMDNVIAIEQEAFALLNLQNSSEIEIATAQRRIDLLKEQRKLSSLGFDAKEAAKTTATIRDSLTDGFTQAIDGTKSLWVSLRDSVEGMFNNMILRPTIQAAMAPIAGAVTSSLFGTAANAATGASATSGLLGNMIPSASMGTLDIAGFSVPQIGLALAGLSLLSSIGGNFVSASDSGRARVDYSSTGVGSNVYSITGDASQTAAAQSSVETLAQSYFKTAAELGINAMAATFEYGSNTGKEGASSQTVLGVNLGNASYSSGEIGSGDSAALTLAASRAVLTALQASEMPSYLAGVFDGITASTATQDQITTALSGAAALKTFHDQLTALPFQRLTDLSYEATQGLIAASGGLDKLQSNLSSYYSNFYSSEEQRLQTIKNINAATAGSGLDAATATRESFRRIVDAQDLSTESGRAMYAALLGVSGAFAGLVPVADAVAFAVTGAVDALQVAIARAQNAMSFADSAMTALNTAVSAEKTALSDQYEADLARLTDAQDAYSQSVTGSISSVSASVGNLQSLSNRLKSSLANSIVGADEQQRRAAQAVVASVLEMAKAGKGLPTDTTALDQALITIAKPSQELFGSFEDYARDFYKTSNDIAALSGITDTALTAQQAMLAQLEAQSAISKAAYSSQAKLLKDQYDQDVKALDTTLASAQKQLDALHGIDTSVLSVADAVAHLAAALGAAKTTQTTSNAVTDDTIRGYIASLKSAGGSESDAVITLAKRAKEVGVTQADIARAMGMTEADVNSYFASFGIPKFAVGTNYVPNDMVAMVHAGEAIIPKAYNPAAGGRGSDNGETAAALRALADRLDRIEANTRATAGHTAGTDRKLARVIPGNALITEVAV